MVSVYIEYIEAITRMDARAYGGLILNITHIAIRNPSSEMYHFDLNEGRYEGEDPK